jgi:hypothetical protein
LTLDYRQTLEFLGLDVARFDAGFNNLDEIFEFVSSSTFFNPELYKLENLNTIARTRDKKRSTYNSFLKFCEHYTGPVWNRTVQDKAEYVPLILNNFPQAVPEFNRAMSDLVARQEYKKRFNGELVSELTGLVDKELGLFMRFLKVDHAFSIGSVLYTPQNKINRLIVDLYKEFKGLK